MTRLALILLLMLAPAAQAEPASPFAGAYMGGTLRFRMDTCSNGSCSQGKEEGLIFDYFVTPELRIVEREAGKIVRMYEIGVAHVSGPRSTVWTLEGDKLVETIKSGEFGFRVIHARTDENRCSVVIEVLPQPGRVYTPVTKLQDCRVRVDSRAK